MNLYTDKELKAVDYLFDLVMQESDRQIHKWNVQTHTAFEWCTYLTEEVGELAEAISEKEYRAGLKSNVVKESIQVATLALKIAEFYIEDGVWKPEKER